MKFVSTSKKVRVKYNYIIMKINQDDEMQSGSELEVPDFRINYLAVYFLIKLLSIKRGKCGANWINMSVSNLVLKSYVRLKCT